MRAGTRRGKSQEMHGVLSPAKKRKVNLYLFSRFC